MWRWMSRIEQILQGALTCQSILIKSSFNYCPQFRCVDPIRVSFSVNIWWLACTQGSVYQKTNAMSEIRKTNKDNFWAQAEVGTWFHLFSLLTRATSVLRAYNTWTGLYFSDDSWQRFKYLSLLTSFPSLQNLLCSGVSCAKDVCRNTELWF